MGEKLGVSEPGRRVLRRVSSSLVDITVVDIEPGSASHRSTCPDGQFWLPVRGEQVVEGAYGSRRQLPFELMYYAPREPAVRTADSATLAYGLQVRLSSLREDEHDPGWSEQGPAGWDATRMVIGLIRDGLDGAADGHDLDEAVAKWLGGAALTGQEDSKARWLGVIETMLDDNPSYTLTDLSREAGVVPAYLSAEFSRLKGVTVSGYRRRVMLRRALALAGSRSLNEAAIEAGFYDASHFHRACVTELGVKATHLRQLIRAS